MPTPQQRKGVRHAGLRHGARLRVYLARLEHGISGAIRGRQDQSRVLGSALGQLVQHDFKVNPMTRSVAGTIKDRMKAIGMSQAWLAEKVGVSIAAVSKWTTDGKIARDNVPRIAAALGLTTDQLLGTGAPAGAEATWPEWVSADEKEMLELYRLCSREGQLMLKGAAREGSKVLGTSEALPGPF